MMGKEQDTYRAAFIYMGTCLPRTSVLHWSTKRGPGCPREAGCAGWGFSSHQTFLRRGCCGAVLRRPRSRAAPEVMQPLRA